VPELTGVELKRTEGKILPREPNHNQPEGAIRRKSVPAPLLVLVDVDWMWIEMKNKTKKLWVMRGSNTRPAD
jgi:hypothetical protein